MRFHFARWSAVMLAGAVSAGVADTSVVAMRSAAFAQDTGKPKAGASVEGFEAEPKGGEAAAPVVVDVRGDAGVDAVQQAEADPAVKYVPNKTAEETLQAFFDTKKGWQLHWDEQKKRYFTIVAQSMNVDDPASDKDFYIKREMLAKRAVLRAKAQIIQYINTKMSATDKLLVPGTDVNAKFSEDFAAAEAKLKSQQEKVAKLLKEYDAKEADALAGATTRDRITALLDAAIKRLDKEFSSDKVEAKKREQLAKAKQRHAEASKALVEIEAQVKSFKGSVQSTQTSDVSLLSSLPLVGATVIEQTESWDKNDEMYQIAVLVCWSAKLEQAARASLTGETVIDDAPKGEEPLTVQQWLQQQELGQMVGPRQFLDSTGQRWFLGITARPVSKNAAVDERNRELAQVFARQMAAYSLFADVDTQTTARQVMLSTENLDKSSTKAAESLEQELTQHFRDLQVQGLGALDNRIVTHPLTGQKLYVAVFGISPESARAAMATERQSALAAITVHKSQAFQKGRSDALSTAVKTAKDDAASKTAGRTQGDSEVNPPKTTTAGTKPSKTGADEASSTKPSTTPGTTKSGSTKTGNVKDNF